MIYRNFPNTQYSRTLIERVIKLMDNSIYKYEYIHNLFSYIENNISSDLDTELLSSISYVSRDKLYYDFYNLCGHSVKKYIRKRRLSNTLALIKASDFPLAEIALECGYSSQQALSGAVKQTLGLTPSKYRDGDIYYFFPSFDGEPIQPVIVSNETIPQMQRMSFYYSKLANIENVAISTFLQACPNYNGRIFGRNGKQRNNRFCYEIYLTDAIIDYDMLKACGFEAMHNVSCFTSSFATSTVPNDEHKINSAWDYLYSEWLQNSMFEYANEPYYEEYILKNGKAVKIKLYLPIRERCEETKIILTNNPALRFITAKAKGYNSEEIASKTVIDYLMMYYPHIINTSKEIYFHKEADTHTCGIRINHELRLIEDKNITEIITSQNAYLVLESNVMGEYERYARQMLSFSKDNAMDADEGGIFAIYDARESFSNIKLKMYCPIKILTK